MPALRVLWLLITLVATWFPGRAAALERVPSSRLKLEVPVALHVPKEAVIQRWTAAHPGQPMQLVLFLPGAWDGPEDFLTKLGEGRAGGHHWDEHRPWSPRVLPSVSIE